MDKYEVDSVKDGGIVDGFNSSLDNQYLNARIELLFKGSLLPNSNSSDKKNYDFIYANQEVTRKFFSELGLDLIIRNDLLEPFIAWRPIKGCPFKPLVSSSTIYRNRSLFYLLLARIFYDPGSALGKPSDATEFGAAVFNVNDLFDSYFRYVHGGGDKVKARNMFNGYIDKARSLRFIEQLAVDSSLYRIHSLFQCFISPEDFMEYSSQLVELARTFDEDKESEVISDGDDE